MTEPETRPMTVRFPAEVYERLRKAAFGQRVPMSKIVIAAVKKELERGKQ